MTHFGSCIDKFEIDFFHRSSLGLFHQRLSQSDRPLLWAHDSTLDKDKVALDDTVVNETTDWIDGFVSDVDNSGTVVLDKFAINSVISGRYGRPSC